ncbi:MAG: DnaD domain protein, partial [Ruminococcus sp.]|nr:DnaD domain protein [Ruminococcus sp.]
RIYEQNSPTFGRYFNVPCRSVENFIKTADGDFFKVLLCALCSDSPMLDSAELAARTGVSPETAADALLFWISNGVLSAEPSSGDAPAVMPAAVPAFAPVMAPVAVAEMPATVPASSESADKPEKKLPSKITVKYSNKEIADKAAESHEIAALYEQVQRVLGRTVNPYELSEFLALYEYYGFSVPSIIILTQYCHDLGKGKARYIETVARDWYDRGITEYADIEQEISRLTEQHKFENKVKKLLHLDLRLTPQMVKLIANWAQWGFSDDMIELADEKCRDAIMKTDLNYINGILKKWHENGITTPAAAAEYDISYAERKKAPDDSGDSSFSIDEWYLQAESYDPEKIGFKEDDDKP